MPLTEKTSTINGLAVHYWEAGDANGYPILLLHDGISDAKPQWGAILPILSDEYHTIAPDLPEFGSSAPVNGGIDTYVEWIHALLDELDLEAVVLVGSAFGALLVRAFATHYPKRVPAAILINGGILPNITPLFAMLARLPIIGEMLYNAIGKSTCSRSSLNQCLHVKSVMTESFVKEVESSGKNFGRALRLIAANPIPEEMTPHVPTLIMWGQEDQLATLNEAKILQKAIPGSKLSEIEACGHLPHLEEPDVFVVQVKNFLYQIRNPGTHKLPGVGRLG